MFINCATGGLQIWTRTFCCTWNV